MLFSEALLKKEKKNVKFEIVKNSLKNTIFKYSIKLQDKNELKNCGLQGLLEIKSDLMSRIDLSRLFHSAIP